MLERFTIRPASLFLSNGSRERVTAMVENRLVPKTFCSSSSVVLTVLGT